MEFFEVRRRDTLKIADPNEEGRRRYPHTLISRGENMFAMDADGFLLVLDACGNYGGLSLKDFLVSSKWERQDSDDRA